MGLVDGSVVEVVHTLDPSLIISSSVEILFPPSSAVPLSLVVSPQILIVSPQTIVAVCHFLLELLRA